MNLAQRSDKKELLDGENIPFRDIEKNMQELNTINSLLGGHSITVKGFLKLAGSRKRITVCEIGCGGGDNLAAIAKWAHAHNVEVHCTGVDLKAACIAVAEAQPALTGHAKWIVSDYADILFDEKPDIIFSSLFCHHFAEEALMHQLQWMQSNSRVGFFINDLHRHWLAYYSILAVTKIFSSSYLVKNDAPISVARGFLKKEWEAVCSKAGITQIEISWQWAFRHLLVYQHAR